MPPALARGVLRGLRRVARGWRADGVRGLRRIARDWRAWIAVRGTRRVARGWRAWIAARCAAGARR
ncbi:MAG: hypothetical protein DWI09_13480 [Planctomycetota bacterium]|nr:MAG: hypothetical protein DWI09_13480 [Planctomycetota bacterium]